MVSVRFGAFAFHADRRQLFRDGTEVRLTPKALDLLAFPDRAGAGSRAKDRNPPATVVNHVRVGRGAGGPGEGTTTRAEERSAGTVIRTAHRVGYAFAG